MSRIAYGNSLWYGVAATNLSKLQRVQNAAVRLVCALPRLEHVTSSFIFLYVFTGCRLSLESISRLLCIHGHARSYLKSMVAIKKTSTMIQPPLEHQYPVGRQFPRRSKKTLGDRRAFSNASAKIWNSLPQSLQSQQNFSTKSLLKTYYFGEGFNV